MSSVLELVDSSEPVSPHRLEQILAELALDLPTEFLDLYSDSNGGTPVVSAVTDGRHVFPVHEFYDWDDILVFRRDLDGSSVPEGLDPGWLLPFACDQGGNTFALYFDTQVPHVCFYTTSDTMTVHGRWASFGEFLRRFVHRS